MNPVKLCFVLSLTTLSCSAMARTPMPRATSLPNVVLDCYQSFTTRTAFPESSWDDGEFPIDGDNFDKPMPRYRLQVVDQAVLKVIEDPTRPAFRKEHGVSAAEMMRDFTNKHSIVGWRERTASGGFVLYTLNFDDLLFSVAEVTSAKASAGIAMKIRYALETQGQIVYSLTGEVNNDEEWDSLRKAFWAKIRLPWGGSTVSVRLVG